jgi:hypothetical protein
VSDFNLLEPIPYGSGADDWYAGFAYCVIEDAQRCDTASAISRLEPPPDFSPPRRRGYLAGRQSAVELFEDAAAVPIRTGRKKRRRRLEAGRQAVESYARQVLAGRASAWQHFEAQQERRAQLEPELRAPPIEQLNEKIEALRIQRDAIEKRLADLEARRDDWEPDA